MSLPKIKSLFRRFRKKKRNPQFLGPQEKWPADEVAVKSFDDPNIVDRYIKAEHVVQNDPRYQYTQDANLFPNIKYSPVVLSFLMLTFQDKDEVQVIDIGGSFGTQYKQARKFIKSLGIKCR